MNESPSKAGRTPLAASLILVSKNRAAGLKKCLYHIRHLDVPSSFEIILVDNGSDDATLAHMQEFAHAAPQDVTVLRTLRPGNSAGRNDAIQQSRGEILIFTDDDCYVHPTFVTEWLAVFSDVNIGYGSGSILPHNSSHSLLGCHPVNRTILFNAHHFFPRGMVQGSNMAFRRSSLASSGLFDERFGAGTRWAGEEWDLALRISRAGWKGGLFPGPVVEHDHGRTDPEAIARLSFYDFGAGAVYAKHLSRPILTKFARCLLAEIWNIWATPVRLSAFLRGAFSYAVARRKHVAQ